MYNKARHNKGCYCMVSQCMAIITIGGYPLLCQGLCKYNWTVSFGYGIIALFMYLYYDTSLIVKALIIMDCISKLWHVNCT